MRQRALFRAPQKLRLPYLKKAEMGVLFYLTTDSAKPSGFLIFIFKFTGLSLPYKCKKILNATHCSLYFSLIIFKFLIYRSRDTGALGLINMRPLFYFRECEYNFLVLYPDNVKFYFKFIPFGSCFYPSLYKIFVILRVI